ncbi:hypothetical protein F4680DRAFT_448133 [Xylaria scruposa]|nr:hypothetical protein F4680DRAFT_448133 [Xylaria scruposa]
MAAEAQDAARDSLPTEESADKRSVPIVSVSNINRTNDNLDTYSFPNSKFPFFKSGIGINPTTIQNTEWASRLRESIAYETPRRPFFKKKTNVAEHRTLFKRNKLGIDETHLKDISDPEEYWNAVMKIAPPRPWMDISKVMKELRTVHPMGEPSDTIQWRCAEKWLDAAIKEGGSWHGWENDADIGVSETVPEFWESIRIVGDAEDGHGIFPSKLRNKMASAGFAWIFANPEERILPQCWEKYASRKGMRFYKSMPIMHQELDGGEAATLIPTGQIIASGQSSSGSQDHPSTLIPQGSRDEFARREPPIMPDEQRQNFQDLYKVLATTLQKAELQNKSVMQSTIERSVQAAIAAGLAETQQTLQESTRTIVQRLDALEGKINSRKNALGYPLVTRGNSAAEIEAEPAHEPDHHQDTSQQVNPVAQAQPTDSQHTTAVIPQKRKDI